MRLSRRRFISISASMAFAAKTGTAMASARSVTWRGAVLGADAQLVIAGLAEKEAQRLIKLTLAEADRLEDIFSLFRNGSALAQLNQTGRLNAPSADMLSVCSSVDAVHKATDGLFDPTIQPLWQAYAENKGRPSGTQLKRARQLVGWGNVRFNSDHIYFRKPGMALSFNGIAQGYITDRVTDLLKAEGLKDAVVKMGEIQAVGMDPAGDPWEISLAGITNSHFDKFRLVDRAIATSAAFGTTFDGVTSHILDPRTGAAAGKGYELVSVTHPSATIADGLSTAALLMDEVGLIALSERFRSAGIIATGADGRTVTHNI